MVPHDPPLRVIPKNAALIDAITNLIDDGIRKQRYETYNEWQAAVEALLSNHIP